MLKQYWQIKAEVSDPDTILFFRLGDFYEMFFDDAKTASSILDITLTSRNKNDPNPIPLCGIPFHSAESYISKLLASGKKIAICEQVEDPKTAKGIVKREIVRVITPGVLMEGSNLVASQNNFLAAVNQLEGDKWAIAICDISTGDLRAAVLSGLNALAREMARIEPKEVVISRSIAEDQTFLKLKNIFNGAMITILDDPNFAPSKNIAIDLSDVPASSYSSISAIHKYLTVTHKKDLRHISKAAPYSVGEHMVVDEATKRNLELTRTIADGSYFGTFNWLIDKTNTAMGGRTLRRWMFYPLLSSAAINERLDAVQTLKDDFHLAEKLKEALALVADIERINSRIVTGSVGAKEMAALKDTLKSIPSLASAIKDTEGMLKNISSRIDPCFELSEKIDATLVNEPSFSIKDGGIIKAGVSGELDELRDMAEGGKDFISRLESQERERTGIGSLKVRYNKVFGYYIEITHTHADKVPENYIRKQTLTNAERFITPELKEYEEKVLGAEERIRQLEYEIFQELRLFAATFSQRIADTAEALGRLDALLSLAVIANQNRYVRPKISEGGEIKIMGGRHPIVERLISGERFVPNDVCMDDKDHRMMMITGPNMAGKSTIMRQTALIILMAQMGSFVPAAEAWISVVDRIFTRVGASDNLIKGESTFMVEMSEAATILREATAKSFIIIDEIGRGTSTYDGVSIAWAVAEYIHDTLKAKTMFATHYHELTDLPLTKEGVKNYNVAVKEWNDQIIFLRKLVEGGVNRSYGIQVARLAGLPLDVITKAKEVLQKLEAGEMALKGADTKQMGLFDVKM